MGRVGARYMHSWCQGTFQAHVTFRRAAEVRKLHEVQALLLFEVRLFY